MFLNRGVKNQSSKEKRFIKNKHGKTATSHIIFSNLLNEQKGGVKILVALLLPFLLGLTALVVDAGLLYLTKCQLQTMADAGALAGAQDLIKTPSQALTNGKGFAYKNGNKSDTVTPTVIGKNKDNLKVDVSRNVDLLFAQIFGIKSTAVKATATATISPAGGATGVIPIGIENKTFVFGQEYILKEGGGNGYCGNYGPLALGGKGGNIYRENLEKGYSGPLKVGDKVPTETGNMVGPTNQGLKLRIDSDPFSTCTTVKPGSKRIVIVPIIHSFAVNGRKDVLIDGFAIFFVKSVHQGEVTGNFMQMVSGNTIPGTGQDFGLYNVRLTK